ncbi:carbohydrate ABC transporter permease [Streptomyces sp. NPDC059679]|uniref:carbohydrate ABC transporter permease n=1 Tax=Streptomyces sp. NPDC059679 TaxID=3346903 RepID=UPI0036CAB26F
MTRIDTGALPGAAQRSRPSPARAPRYGAASRALTRGQRRAGWLLLTPALAHMSLFVAVPMLMALGFSFFRYDFLQAPEWVGLDNYRTLLDDDRFHTALWNTTLYTVVVVPVGMALALLIALGLDQKIKARGFFRTAYYLPHMTATVAIAVVWLWLLDPNLGALNNFLALFGIARTNWLGSTDWALPAIMVLGIWQGLGTKMVIYLAALQTVPRELKEAAQLDGANRRQVFRAVTWPSIASANLFVLVTSVIFSFQVFEQVYVMTRGGPINSTLVLTYDIYLNAFTRLKFGYACAETVVFVLIIGVVTAVVMRLARGARDD